MIEAVTAAYTGKFTEFTVRYVTFVTYRCSVDHTAADILRQTYGGIVRKVNQLDR